MQWLGELYLQIKISYPFHIDKMLGPIYHRLLMGRRILGQVRSRSYLELGHWFLLRRVRDRDSILYP